MMNITLFIIKLAPIGVFGLIIKAVATTGLGIFKAVGLYVLTIATGLTIHLFVILPLIFYFFTKINPIQHFKAMPGKFIWGLAYKIHKRIWPDFAVYYSNIIGNQFLK